MAKSCVRCGGVIPEGRLKILPNAMTCVNCSTTKMKRSITITAGEREDTYNDIVIVDADDYERMYQGSKPSSKLGE